MISNILRKVKGYKNIVKKQFIVKNIVKKQFIVKSLRKYLNWNLFSISPKV